MQWLIVNATTPETILRPFGHFDGAIRGRTRLVMVVEEYAVSLQDTLACADLLAHGQLFPSRGVALRHLYRLAQHAGVPAPNYQMDMQGRLAGAYDDGFADEADAIAAAQRLAVDDTVVVIWDLHLTLPDVVALVYQGQVYRLDTAPALVAPPHPPPTGGIWGDLQAGIDAQDRNKGGPS